MDEVSPHITKLKFQKLKYKEVDIGEFHIEPIPDTLISKDPVIEIQPIPQALIKTQRILQAPVLADLENIRRENV